MEPDPYEQIIVTKIFNYENIGNAEVLIGIPVMLAFLCISALISGSEVACFSLSPANISELKTSKSRKNKYLLKLLNKPQNLLATILITNNFVNVGIIILSTFITNTIFDFSDAPNLGFLFHVVIVTFLLLLFGEIIPKIYAAQNSMKFATFMTIPLHFLEKIFRPLSKLLIKSTSIVKKRIQKKTTTISIDDLSEALNLTGNSIKEDKDILQGIIKFKDTSVKGILKPRMDVVAIDLNNSHSLPEILEIITTSGFSRIPIYQESFDNVKGILYSKDLLNHLDDTDNFDWSNLIRKPYFVPESKKINDLLEEFQIKKIHMAIVIDEYGGTSGIVTMEDVLEEIVGEISDEYDEEEAYFLKIRERNYIFEGKTLLNDFCKIINTDIDLFEEIKGEAETLAGLILEIKGELPQKGDEVTFRNFKFTSEDVDNRRISKIRVEWN